MRHAYSIYETKTQLSRLLEEVQKGHELIITKHGEEIAKIIPFVKKEESFEERIQRLTREGVVRPRRPSSKKIQLKPVARRPGALKRFLRDR